MVDRYLAEERYLDRQVGVLAGDGKHNLILSSVGCGEVQRNVECRRNIQVSELGIDQLTEASVHLQVFGRVRGLLTQMAHAAGGSELLHVNEVPLA